MTRPTLDSLLGGDHLGLDAIVAYSDGAMGLTAYQRAAAHVQRCPSCSAEVTEQTVARRVLRSAPAPGIPTGLFESLRSIPLALPLERGKPDR